LDIAAEFLKLALNGKTAEAVKLCDSQAALARQVDEIANSGLKVSRFRMMLLNDTRVAVVTERTKFAVKPGGEPVEGSLVITLERVKPSARWLVRDMDFNDEARLLARIGRYLDGGFDFKPGVKKAEPKQDPKGPTPGADVAADFLEFALAGKDADAVGLTVPGTVSENKVGEIRNVGYNRPDLVAVLINDTRIEVVTKQKIVEKEGEEAGHLVIMVTRSKDGSWQVKDIDFRDQKRFETRVLLYLEGRYDVPAERK
jgi:hypothetical protein